MNSRKIPWLSNPLPDQLESSIQDPRVQKYPRLESILEILRRHWPILLILLTLISLFAIKDNPGSPEKTALLTIPAIASRIPIFKGDIIETLALEEVTIAKSGLTKNQAWSLLQLSVEQLGPDLKLRAKKDVPPRKPLLWSEVEIIRPQDSAAAPAPRKIRIVYPNPASRTNSTKENP